VSKVIHDEIGHVDILARATIEMGTSMGPAHSILGLVKNRPFRSEITIGSGIIFAIW
jgi:hypothetical protein